VQDHGAGVGQLDPGGVALQWRARRRHQVRDDVHRLAGRCPAHLLLQQRPHLRRGAPVVVGAGVRSVVRGHDGALLGARGVLGVAAGVVAAAACGEELAGGQGLFDQPGVVRGVDDLDPVGTGQLEPVPHVLPDPAVGQFRLIEDGVNGDHDSPSSRVRCCDERGRARQARCAEEHRYKASRWLNCPKPCTDRRERRPAGLAIGTAGGPPDPEPSWPAAPQEASTGTGTATRCARPRIQGDAHGRRAPVSCVDDTSAGVTTIGRP
jgi:hypothetical protein